MSNFENFMKGIETKYQRKWEEAKIFESNPDPNKEKFFLIWAYPGVSGFMHIGHMRGYSYLDIIARYKRMQGYNVLFPVGVHASGIPTVGFSLKVKNKEEATINYLLENNCPVDFIPKLADPLVALEYFSKEYISSWKEYGFTFDSRYFVSTISLEYQKFIQWQFKKLQDLELLIKKPHYSPWCPVDGPIAVDPSETDISKGGDAELLEFILIKFKAGWIGDNSFFVTGTLRPETVYGVTNIWVNPTETYVLIELDDEKWVVSETCAKSMKLGNERKIVDTFQGKELMSKYVYNNATDLKIPILPGSFVEDNIATGIVMSVPAHAPFDWIALEDLKEVNSEFKDLVSKIKPISIIDSPLGGFSAKEACLKYSVESQKDTEKIQLATEEVYKIEFHKGIITCKEFYGRNISEAKEEIVKTLEDRGIFSTLRIVEFSKEVICRCGNKVSIRMIPNQWFIKYRKEELKEKTIEHAKSMIFYPEQYRSNFRGIIDWYDDRACARQGKWLGTALPQDKEWVIEPIADSTLYPIFYIIAKYINGGEISCNMLSEEFFDYVFLEKGDLSTVSSQIKIKRSTLEEIKEAIAYWYPLDLNLGGKEHQSVHFPVFVMNHIAILKPSYWPKGIFVNYWVVQKEESESSPQATKLSKSKGGAKPIQQYIVDGVRLYFSHSKSAHQDVEWNAKTAEIYTKHLSRIYELIKSILNNLNKKSAEDYTDLDKFLQSRINKYVQKITDSFETTLNFRYISQEIYYSIYKTLIHYLNRGGANTKILVETLQTWISLMCPFTPHLAEEFWSMMKLEGFVSNSSFPKTNQSKIDSFAEQKEEYLLELLSDINKVQKMMKSDKENQIEIIISPKWKESILRRYRSSSENLISEIMKDSEVSKQGNPAVQYAKKLLKNRDEIPYSFDRTTEYEIIENAKEYIEATTNSLIQVNFFEESESPKKNQAEPFRPAIFFY